MAKFASASKQSASVMKELQGNVLKSVGTVRNYEQALTNVAEYAKAEKIDGGLRAMTPEQAANYLEMRSPDVGQKTLDMERQAIQSMMQNVTSKLKPNERLEIIKSDQPQNLQSRAYSSVQVSLIANAQNERNSLSTEIAYSSGLRAHELLTLRPEAERPADDRPVLDSKFQGRDKGVTYTVEGKGGLIREVIIPVELANRLEYTRLNEPIQITDRGVHYSQQYDISGGQRWSNSFSSASNRILGHSEGAHGIRHTYAQERMSELQKVGLTRYEALETVSQELGHFRPEITEVYLR